MTQMKLKPIVTDTYDFPTLIRDGKTAKAALRQIAENGYAMPYASDRAVGKSARTVDRALAELIANKVVEFRGAPKTGGYYAC